MSVCCWRRCGRPRAGPPGGTTRGARPLLVGMPLVQGIRLSEAAAPPAQRVFNALFVLLFLSPVFYLVWGIWISGVGYYFIGGSFIFILVAIGDIKKKIAFGDRSGVSCCSGLFLTLGILCLVLALSFVLQVAGVCALACSFGFWTARTQVSFDRVLFPIAVVLAVASCELLIFQGLRALLKIASWREVRVSQQPDGFELLGLALAHRAMAGSSHVRELPGAQWVHRAVAASSESDTNPRHDTMGRPRIYPRYGDLPGAWAPRVAEQQAEEWLEIQFLEAWQIGAIEVYETYLPGSVVAVKLKDPRSNEWRVAWQGPSQRGDLPPVARIFSPPLTPLGFATRHVRLELQMGREALFGGRPVRPQIDAVRVLRHDQPAAAVATATAIPDATLVNEPTPGGNETDGIDLEAPAPVQAVVVGAVPADGLAVDACISGEDAYRPPTSGPAAPSGPVPGRVVRTEPVSRGRPSRAVPPLVEITEILRLHLGIVAGSMEEVVGHACVELAIDPAGMSLMQQATACWRALGAPPSIAPDLHPDLVGTGSTTA